MLFKREKVGGVGKGRLGKRERVWRIAGGGRKGRHGLFEIREK